MVGVLGLRAAVATPIVVGGRRWGVTVAATSREDFPSGTESRMADFMELAATAVANAKAEEELRELAGTQAALRRLAVLVARGEPPEAVFAAATREALRHFGGGGARMIRYEPDGTATLVAREGTTDPDERVGERWEGYPPAGLTAVVRRTGQPARVDDYRDIPGGASFVFLGGAGDVPTNVPVGTRVKLRYYSTLAAVRRTGRAAQVDEDAWSSVSDPFADALRKSGIRSMAASPIIVEGRLWGA